MSSFTHTIFPGAIPSGYFDPDNIEFIRQKTTQILLGEFHQKINIDKGSIIRIMQRVLGERLESIPKMNQRVLLYLSNEFRVHQMDLKKHISWEENFIESQRLYDPTCEVTAADMKNIKLTTTSLKPKVGGTSRFTFI